MRRQLCCCLISVCTCLASPAQADNYALLVGVSSYPSLPPQLRLEGPRADVILLQQVLQQRGYRNDRIEVLADGVPDAGQPTHANILAAFERLASKVQRDDFVFMSFAGHGSQQPSAPGKMPPEPDNLDEIFLPIDIGQWDGKIGAVPNALLDTEVNHALNRIRERGAFVWIVFDSCHSAGMSRGAPPDEVRYRNVPTAALGIPAAVLAKAASSAAHSRGGSTAPEHGALGIPSPANAQRGGLVAFYAAQSIETTPEMPLPQTSMERAQHGLFTYTLAEVLSRYDGISYRQLSQQVLQHYAARAQRAPTPLFEGGSALDRTVFGGAANGASRQWPLQVGADGTLSIAAGSLQQFGDGAIFALMDQAADADSATLGYLRASSVSALRSTLQAHAYNGKPAPAATQLRTNTIARLVDPQLQFTLRVALPGPAPRPDKTAVDSCTRQHSTPPSAAQAGVLEQALALVRAPTSANQRLTWVAEGKPADLRLMVAGDKLWLLPADGQWLPCGDMRSPSLALGSSPQLLATALSTSLTTAAKAINVLRLANAVGGGGSAAQTGQVQVTASLIRKRDGQRSKFDEASRPQLRSGDKLEFQIDNKGRAMVDVSVLFLDSNYGIQAVFPEAGRINRIEAGGKLGGASGELSVEIDTSSVGLEHLLVITTEAEPQSPMSDFTFLAQAGLAQTRGVGSELDSLLSEAGFGASQHRGLVAPKTLSNTSAHLFGWKTVAK